MKLFELFNKFSYNWVTKQSNYWRAVFSTKKDIEYSVTCTKEDGWLENKKHIEVWELSFTQTHNSLTGTKTGTGDELLIFSTAINAFKEFIQSEKPKLLRITSVSKDQSRVDLYERLAKRFSKDLEKMGYSRVSKELKHEIECVNKDDHEWISIYFERKE